MGKTVEQYADAIMGMIRADIAANPLASAALATARSFEDLHACVDANDYLSQAGVPFGTDPGAGIAGVEIVNAVSAEVSRRLAAGELR